MKAFAAKIRGVISIATVSPTDIGAMVNALVTEFEIMPTNRMSDDVIRAIWDKAILGTGTDAVVVEVQITEA